MGSPSRPGPAPASQASPRTPPGSLRSASVPVGGAGSAHSSGPGGGTAGRIVEGKLGPNRSPLRVPPLELAGDAEDPALVLVHPPVKLAIEVDGAFTLSIPALHPLLKQVNPIYFL